MKLEQLFELEKVKVGNDEEEESSYLNDLGTYAGVYPSSRSSELIYHWCEDFEVPNIVDEDLLHCTLIYSDKKYLKDFEPEGLLDRPMRAYDFELDIWDSKDGSKCLVAKFDSPELVERHNKIMEEYDLEEHYDQFTPHVTLSYDLEDFKPDLSRLSYEFNTYVGYIEFTEEYSEILDTEFVKNKGLKKDK